MPNAQGYQAEIEVKISIDEPDTSKLDLLTDAIRAIIENVMAVQTAEHAIRTGYNLY